MYLTYLRKAIDRGRYNSQLKLLDSYNTERYPLLKNQVKKSDAAFKMMLLRHPISRQIRDRLMSIMLDLEPIQQRMDRRLAMLTINYRNSPIVEQYRELPIPSGHPIKEIAEFKQWRDFGEAPHAGDKPFGHGFATRSRFCLWQQWCR
ncbi:MAG: hypothetical protein QNJ72_14700 [Pleurocapsa sp. MO_226.B13]|nr:hypothetical protein [Pleurocapsa sp. MO_226.B13]